MAKCYRLPAPPIKHLEIVNTHKKEYIMRQASGKGVLTRVKEQVATQRPIKATQFSQQRTQRLWPQAIHPFIHTGCVPVEQQEYFARGLGLPSPELQNVLVMTNYICVKILAGWYNFFGRTLNFAKSSLFGEDLHLLRVTCKEIYISQH